MKPSRRVLIVGCGYVGEAAAWLFRAGGYEVFGLRRSDPTPLPKGLPYTPLKADVTRLESLMAIPARFDWVINTVSSSRGGVGEYREVYWQGTRNLLEWLQPSPPAAFAYTSSTSVYAQDDGSWVDETAPTRPTTETGQWLVETENLLLSAHREWGFPARILRVAGIYGPGRGHLFRQFLAGEAALEEGGKRWMNMIHRDDVAGALQAVLEGGKSGEVYNACDREPVSQKEFLQWLARETGRPMPSDRGPARGPDRKRAVTHKRVSSEKLQRETGWTPLFSTFREGYAAELDSLGDMGAERR